MEMRKYITAGAVSGLAMGMTLFIAGVVLARIIYGPQMAPAGKFEPDQLNPFYFIWTKLLIGILFGVLFAFVYEKLPLSKRIISPFQGLKYSFFFWLVLSLWNLSHPLVYESINYTDKIFWLLYTLSGFLAFGYTLGIIYKKFEKKSTYERNIDS